MFGKNHGSVNPPPPTPRPGRDWLEGEPVYVPEPPPPWFPGYGFGPAVPPPAGPLPAPAPRVTAPIVGWLLLGTAVLAVLGAALPWATVFGEAIVGTSGDGQLVIGCAVAVGACAMVIGAGHGRLWAALVALGFALLIVLIATADIANVTSVVTDDDVALQGVVDVGGGLWLTLVAGVGAALLSVVALIRREPAGAPPCAGPPGPTA